MPGRFPLTTSTDALSGSGTNDTFNGVLQADGATGTTIQAGDAITGGAGTDTLAVSVAGNAGGAFTVSAVNTSGVEKVLLSNFDTDATADGTVVATALMDGLTTVGLSASGANGDTVFSGMKTFVDAEMRNGAGDLKLTYDGAQSVSGETDSQNLTVSNLTGGTFTADGIETINVTTETSKSTLTNVVSDALKTLNISGDQDLKITGAIASAASANGSDIDLTIDASSLTGALTAKMDTAADYTVSLTAGSGNDTLNFQDTLTKNDVVDGGAGTDTLTMNAASLDEQFAQVSGFETVAFTAGTASATMDVSKLPADVTTVQMDLSDATDANGVVLGTFSNLEGQTVVLKHTVANAADTNRSDGVNYTVTNKVDTASDVVNVTLDAIGFTSIANNATSNFGVVTLDVANFETVNLESKKSSTVTANEVRSLTDTSATSLNISGDADLTITQTGTDVTSVDASALAAKLNVTLGANKVAVTGTAKDDTIAFAGNLNNDDSVTGGAGDDTVTATVTGLTATTGALTIADVEAVNLTTSGANTLDLSGVTGSDVVVAVTDNKQTITGFDLSQTLQLGLAADESATSSEIDVTAADATGTADTLKVKVENTNGATTSIIDASAIETLALEIIAAGNGATLDLTTFEGNTVTVDSKSGVTATAALALGTLHENINTVTSTYADKVTVSFANSTSAATFTGVGTDIQDVTGSDKGDTITIGSTGAIKHVVSGGAGTDTVNLTGTTDLADVSGLDAETINLTVAAAAENDVSSGTFHTGVDNITLSGGNSLSKFTSGTLVDEIKTFDSSNYLGNVVLTLTEDKVDDTIVLTGGASTKDEVSFVLSGTDGKLYSTGIEIVNVDINTDLDILDLANTSGVTRVDVDVEGLSASDDLGVVDNITSETISIVKAHANSTTEAKLADATGSADSLTFTLVDAATNIDAGIKLKTTDIETVTVKVENEAESIDLSLLTMATDGEVMTLNVTGDEALTVSATSSDITTIDASGMATGGSLVQTGRSATAAVNYTGSDGDDTFIMAKTADVIAGGAGTGDTLDIDFAAILGGLNVDLTSTTDQIVSMNGSAAAGTVTGFENVDASGYSGSFGAQITGNDEANRVNGTTNADQVSLGKGDDVYVLDDTTTDTVDAGAGTNSLALVGGVTIANTIDFGTYTNFDKIVVAEASASAFKFSAKADVDTDMPDLRTIDLSGDTNTSGSNVVDLSLVSGTYTVIGSAGVDTITGSVGVDLIDVSAASSDTVIIKAAADTGVATAGGASTSTSTIDVIKVEAGDKVDLTGVVETNAHYDGFETITESGNLALVVTASSANADTHSLQARGVYDADANTFTHAIAANANSVLVSVAATDAGTTATDSVLLVGVTSLTGMTDGIITV